VLVIVAIGVDAKAGTLKKLSARLAVNAKKRAHEAAHRVEPADVPEWCRDANQVKAHARAGLAAGSSSQTCEFYRICVEPIYGCGNAPGDEQTYPENYGKKYCTKFADHSWASGKGRTWRDQTLQCLQASLVPWVQSRKGNCEALTTFAFDSHVPCYTQPGASICELMRPSPSDGGITARGEDLLKIARTPDGSDLLTRRSARQMAGVVEECAGQVTNYAVDTIGDAVGEAAETAYDWAVGLIGGDD